MKTFDISTGNLSDTFYTHSFVVGGEVNLWAYRIKARKHMSRLVELYSTKPTLAGSVIPELWKFYMQKYIVVLPLSPLGFFYFKHHESWLCFITACQNIAMIALQDNPWVVADIWRSLKFYRWNWLFWSQEVYLTIYTAWASLTHLDEWDALDLHLLSALISFCLLKMASGFTKALYHVLYLSV